uniref:HDC17297 n=1 Tax=Drosophila melanogaster TaxID=7227 RepID=Q6IIR6_DROME|nr:TPA_inf: HDC17297 [Drosophila melanogaster]
MATPPTGSQMVFVVPPKRKVINGMEWNGMVCPDATYHAASHVRLKRAPEAEKQEAVLRKNESGTMWSCGAVELWSCESVEQVQLAEISKTWFSF